MTKKKMPLARVDFGKMFEFRGRQYRTPSKETFWLKNMHLGNHIEVSLDTQPHKKTKFKKDTLVVVYFAD